MRLQHNAEAMLQAIAAQGFTKPQISADFRHG
jgi:hypothetical protein